MGKKITAFFALILLLNVAYCKEKTLSLSSCVNCHSEINHKDILHPAESCISCHKGNNREKDKDKSHANMFARPGNLSNVNQTCGLCHPEETKRVQHSMMTTNKGLIKVNREVFNESTGHPSWENIDFHKRASDGYFAQLCANCHLGKEKTYTGAWKGYEKGGGCLACHLDHSSKDGKKVTHPSIHNNTKDERCFNCHSRSGRISLNYKGLQERTSPDKDQVLVNLPDGRKVYKAESDIHHKAGMQCIDCHTSQGIMGDGKNHEHKEEAVKIECEDCHKKDKVVKTKSKSKISKNDLKYWKSFLAKKIKETPKQNSDSKSKSKPKPKNNDLNYITTHKSKEKLKHIFSYKDSPVFLKRKKDGKFLVIPTLGQHYAHGDEHKNLSCDTCHTRWAPQCIGCHISYIPEEKGYNHMTGKAEQGRWQEEFGEFFADLPTLGRLKDGTIKPFIPGMKLTIDTSAFYKKKKKQIDKNLFSPASPHTIGKSRTCESCHMSPLALGYGRGSIQYKKGKWKFYPEYQIELSGPNKGIALDGWIAPLFHLKMNKTYSTRKGATPLSYKTQKKVLEVGFCLGCHKGESTVFIDFATKKNYKHKKATQ